MGLLSRLFGLGKRADDDNEQDLARSERGECHQAVTDVAKAMRLADTEAEAHDNQHIDYHERGLAYAGRGEYDRAIAEFTEAIQLNPADTVASTTEVSTT